MALTSIAVLGEAHTFANKVAVLLIAIGIISLALSRNPSGLADTRAMIFALATGTCTAAYTVVDGLGARTAGSAHSYMVWLSLVTSLLIVGVVNALQRGLRPTVSRRTSRAGIAAGMMSYGGSWVVIWAMTQAPLALVSALRETGVVFAVAIGALVLKVGGEPQAVGVDSDDTDWHDDVEAGTVNVYPHPEEPAIDLAPDRSCRTAATGQYFACRLPPRHGRSSSET